MSVILELFAVKNKEGKYFKSRGMNASGDRWVNKLKDAKIYMKQGPAKAICTWYSKNYPEYGIPELLVLNVTEIEVIDQTKRVNKVIERHEQIKTKRDAKHAEYNLKLAQRKFQEAEENLKKLKEKNGLS